MPLFTKPKFNIIIPLMKKKILYFAFIIHSLWAAHISAQELTIDKDDVFVIQDPEGRYPLYIKKKEDIKSVLLTETTKHPELKLDNYAYRSGTYNKINGDEKRLLNNEFLDPEKKLYSLIDSTPEDGTPIGTAYHIWIPYIIEYGYDWGRKGEVEVADGTFFNIRAFSKPYGDYSGGFKDNPFMLRLTQKPVDPPIAKPVYSGDAADAFSSLSEKTGGQMYRAAAPEDILPLIRQILTKDKNEHLDVLFALDATESMRDDIKAVRSGVAAVLTEVKDQYKSCRVALVLYKDYRDDFLVRDACTFTGNIKKFEKALNGFQVFGGRDIPEAVYEGIYAGLKHQWRSKDDSIDKKLILIGDAPPHPRPRGKISRNDVDELAAEKNVSVYTIILPHDLSY